MAAWIEMLPVEGAEGDLADAYAAARTPHGTVDNVMRAHSLRPHTMLGHIALYRSVLHHPGNTLPLWFLEVVAAVVSHANGCAYSFGHHWTNARRLMKDPSRASAVEAAILGHRLADVFDGKELALLAYAERLTVDVAGIDEASFRACVAAGASHGEILEVNQVTAYFNYSNRLLNGLGVTTEGDHLGFYDD